MFQHITTEIHNNEIIFFGRQENKKSIAVRIQNYKPHRIIKCSAPLAAVSAVLKTAVNEHYIWRKNTIHGQSLDIDSFHDLIQVKEVEGRSITSADNEETFFKAIAKDIDAFTCLEQVLRKPYEYIYNVINGSYISRKKSLTLWMEQFDKVSLVTQYCVAENIQTCTTMEATGIDAQEKVTTCNREVIGTVVNSTSIVSIPLHSITYDIETLFDIREKDSYKQPIITIGAICNGKQHAWILHPEKEQIIKLAATEGAFHGENTFVHNFHDELSMLTHFFQFVIDEDADIIQGHNVECFDHPYIIKRYEMLSGEYPCWGRIKVLRTTLCEAYCSTTLKIPIHGRVTVDSCSILRREVKSNSYKLDDLGEEFLHESKIHLPYTDIQKHYQTTYLHSIFVLSVFQSDGVLGSIYLD